jgi:hypothetical protein
MLTSVKASESGDTLMYRQSPNGDLSLRGMFEGDSLQINLRRKDPDEHCLHDNL